MNNKDSLKRKSTTYFLITLLLGIYTLSSSVKAEENNLIISEKPIEVIISRQEDLEPLKLNLSKTLKSALKSNLNIAITKDKVEENKLKLDEIKSKKLFLFFKFTNANALIDSAKYSLKAAEAKHNSTVNNVIYEATSKYYTLLQALLTKKIAEDFLEKGKLTLKENNELLNIGNATKFDVKQSEVFVENLKQNLLEADIAYMMSSVDLAQYINEEDFNVRIIPEEFNLLTNFNGNGNEIPIQKLNLIPDNLLLNNCIKVALDSREEIKELNYQIKALEEMKKATKFDEIKEQTLISQVNQLKNSLKMTQNTIKATVTQSLLKLIGSKNEIIVAKQKYLLSQKALEQARISRKEGFGTNKNIIDAQIVFANSKNDYINAINKYNKSQVYLLKELGIIDINIIHSNKPIILPAETEEETKEKTASSKPKQKELNDN